MRKGDHQAVVDMVLVKVAGSDFKTVGKVSGEEAVGPDKCEKFDRELLSSRPSVARAGIQGRRRR